MQSVILDINGIKLEMLSDNSEKAEKIGQELDQNVKNFLANNPGVEPRRAIYWIALQYAVELKECQEKIELLTKNDSKNKKAKLLDHLSDENMLAGNASEANHSLKELVLRIQKLVNKLENG